MEEVSRSRSAGKHGMLGDIHLQKLEVIEQPSSPTSSQFALKFTWNLPQDGRKDRRKQQCQQLYCLQCCNFPMKCINFFNILHQEIIYL